MSDKPEPQILPPDPHGTKDGWHVLIISGDAEDPEVTMLHPASCAVTISNVPMWDGSMLRYECHTEDNLRDAGYDGMFERQALDPLPLGMWLVHPWVTEIRGFDWTEYDGGWTVLSLKIHND